MIQLSLNLDPAPASFCTVCGGTGEFLEDGKMVYCLCEAGEALEEKEYPDSMMAQYNVRHKYTPHKNIHFTQKHSAG
jgi:hypothetical protein